MINKIEYERIGQHDYFETIRVAANRVCTIQGSSLMGSTPRRRLLQEREWCELEQLLGALPEASGEAANDAAFATRVIVHDGGGRRDLHFAGHASDDGVESLVRFLQAL